MAYPNLAADPNPVNLLNWVGGVGGGGGGTFNPIVRQDSTYASKGVYLEYNGGNFGGFLTVCPNSTDGITVNNQNPSYAQHLGPTTVAYPIIPGRTLVYSFNVWCPVTGVTFGAVVGYAQYAIWDAAGTLLVAMGGTPQSTRPGKGPVVFAPGDYKKLTGSVNFDTILAAYPTAAYVTIWETAQFNVGGPFTAGTGVYLGSMNVNYQGPLPVPYYSQIGRIKAGRTNKYRPHGGTYDIG